jgi:hypothetical protein
MVLACGGGGPAPTPVIDENGTALEPLPPDPAFESAARERCPALPQLGSLPETLDFQDRRDDTTAWVQFVDDVKLGGCLVTRGADGSYTASHPQSSSHFMSQRWQFGDSVWVERLGDGRLIAGYVPDEVAAVWIERSDGARVLASLGHRHFIAWWKADTDPAFVVGLSPGGFEVGRKAVWVDPSL